MPKACTVSVYTRKTKMGPISIVKMLIVMQLDNQRFSDSELGLRWDCAGVGGWAGGWGAQLDHRYLLLAVCELPAKSGRFMQVADASGMRASNQI